jgi:hypothetical protein
VVETYQNRNLLLENLQVVFCQYVEVKGVYKYQQMMEICEDLEVKDTCKYQPLMHSY